MESEMAEDIPTENKENVGEDIEENSENDRRSTRSAKQDKLRELLTSKRQNGSTNNDNISQKSLFSCHYCFFETNRQEVFIFHQKKHVIVHNYKCDECKFSTDYIQNLKDHNCASFSTRDLVVNPKEELQNHLSQRSTQSHSSHTVADSISDARKQFECKICSFTANSKGSMKLHSFVHIEGVFRCRKCDYTTNIKKVMDAHEAEHNKDVYKCSYCPYTSSRLVCMTRHTLSHKKPQILNCRKCDFKTENMNDLQCHEDSHIEEPEEPQPLPTVVSAELPQITKSRVLMCIKCNYKAQGHNDLAIHEKTHSQNAKTKNYNCPICNYGSNVEPEFEKHLRSHRSTDLRIQKYLRSKKYKCPYCKYKSNDDGVLENHVVNVHKLELLEEENAVTEEDLQDPEELPNSNSDNMPVSSSHSLPSKFRWSTNEKREIYWCHLYAKYIGKHSFKNDLRQSMMLQRGIISSNKVLNTPNPRFHSLVANMKVGRTCLKAKDLNEIEADVLRHIKVNGLNKGNKDGLN